MAVPQNLSEKIKGIPQLPGIYKMKDSDNNIIYVGKSKNLNARVKSYFSAQHEWSKIKRLVFHIKDIDFIVTDTHIEAQLLECALIKKLKPLYNSQYKNDSRYVYLKLNQNPQEPIIAITKEKEANTLGPFRSKGMLTRLIDGLQGILPITKEKEAYNFSYSILKQQMKAEAHYESYRSLKLILTDAPELHSFLKLLESRMREAAIGQQFERAQYFKELSALIGYAHRSPMDPQEDGYSGELLMGERVDGGYKLFFINSNRLILKMKADTISTGELAIFIEKAREKAKLMPPLEEKRALDFKNIIASELKDTEGKAILYLQQNPDAGADFIDSLRSLA